jgi:hypothetical protein
MRAKNQCLLCRCSVKEKNSFVLAPVSRTKASYKEDLLDIKFNSNAKFLICNECVMNLVFEKRFKNKLQLFDGMADKLSLGRDGEEIKIIYSGTILKNDATQENINDLIRKMAIESLKK